MGALDDGLEVEDLESQQSVVLVYGIVAIVLGVLSFMMLFVCMACNVPAPFACLIGALSVYRTIQVMKPIQEAGLSDTKLMVGLILGIVGLVFGLIGFVGMLIMGCCTTAYFGLIGLLVFISA